MVYIALVGVAGEGKIYIYEYLVNMYAYKSVYFPSIIFVTDITWCFTYKHAYAHMHQKGVYDTGLIQREIHTLLFFNLQMAL